MAGTLQKTVSGVLWTPTTEERHVGLARQAAEVARFEGLKLGLSALELEVLVRRYGLGRNRQSVRNIALDLRLGAPAVREAERNAMRKLLAAFGVTDNMAMDPEEFDVRQTEPARPRAMDIDSAMVADWRRGCLLCDEEEVNSPLPHSDGALRMPLCERHVRWAMASRRERIGKPARHLKRLLLAWVRQSGQDGDAARRWLGY